MCFFTNNKKSICLIDPSNGDVLKEIFTGFLLTGGFAVFKDLFYMGCNNGGGAFLY